MLRTRRGTPKPFQCLECGKRMTTKQAEHAVYGDGCPNCGGADIEEANDIVHAPFLHQHNTEEWRG